MFGPRAPSCGLNGIERHEGHRLRPRFSISARRGVPVYVNELASGRRRDLHIAFEQLKEKLRKEAFSTRRIRSLCLASVARSRNYFFGRRGGQGYHQGSRQTLADCRGSGAPCTSAGRRGSGRDSRRHQLREQTPPGRPHHYREGRRFD